MKTSSRSYQSIINARVNTVFFVLVLFLSFFSRKVFISNFGSEFVGLTSTVANLLDFLNLAEMGLGAAVGVVLYKSLNDKDQNTINEIISVFAYFYRIIGLIIIILGISLSLFLPIIFPNIHFSLSLLYCIYFIYLINVSIGYFANYTQTLLGADQKNYIIVTYFQTANIIKTCFQIGIAIFTGNVFLWIAVELIFGISYSILLNRKVKKIYPWLSINLYDGKHLRSKYPNILIYARQLFVQKISGLVQIQIKPLLIYSFSSLNTVTLYGNYGIIITKLSQLITNLLGSTSAGIGLMVAEGDDKKILSVFRELDAVRYYLTGVAMFSVFYLINPFVEIWLGTSFLLPWSTLILIVINTTINQTRGTVDQFLNGYGIFHDTWAPISESIVSLSISLIAGYYCGLDGILLGTTISLIIFVTLWKPLLLFHSGFKIPVWIYWKTIFKYYLISAMSWIISYLILQLFNDFLIVSYLHLILKAILVVSVFSIINFIGFYFLNKEFMHFIKRIIDRILTRK
ncbi:O-antigen flippase Wzx [Sphingobacterium faecium PCAi_F2.5]|nr:O-antigen flippase Wzx [Sphingobacterium faecium PCAi_F2.5]